MGIVRRLRESFEVVFGLDADSVGVDEIVFIYVPCISVKSSKSSTRFESAATVAHMSAE